MINFHPLDAVGRNVPKINYFIFFNKHIYVFIQKFKQPQVDLSMKNERQNYTSVCINYILLI